MTGVRILLAVSLLAGCAAPEPRSASWLAEPGLVYCYRTLAEADCYRQPQPGAERRLLAAAPQVFFTPLVPLPTLPAGPRAIE